MNFLKALWRSIMPGENGHCDTPSQYVVCPYCNIAHKDQTPFEQEHAEFEEGENVTQMVYTCGHCTVKSLWFTDTGELLYISSYGVTLGQLRYDVQDHFRSWSVDGNNPTGLLKSAIAALNSNLFTLQREEQWTHREHSEIFKQGCAVDLVLYGLLLSGSSEVGSELVKRFTVKTPCTEIETYLKNLPRNLSNSHYQTLLRKIAKHISYLESSYTSAFNVPYIFVQPAVEASAADLLAIGLQMLQMQNKQQFHQLVYERLRHFVFMSV